MSSNKKRKAYTRRKSGETKAHDARRVNGKIMELNYREFQRACDKFLVDSNAPRNSLEERHLKETIRTMRADRKRKRYEHNVEQGKVK